MKDKIDWGKTLGHQVVLWVVGPLVFYTAGNYLVVTVVGRPAVALEGVYAFVAVLYMTSLYFAEPRE